MAHTIFIVTGEVSGDFHAAHLVKELQVRMPDVEFYAMGGVRLKEAGVTIVQDIKELSVTGVFEVLRNLSTIKAAFYRVLDWIKINKPAAVIFVDYPGFNLRLAEKVHALGITTFYYISPQVWAWGKNRIQKIKQIIDHMIVIFAFEKTLYAQHGVDAFFAGHPLMDTAHSSGPRAEIQQQYGIDPQKKTVGFFPGSRTHEVKSLFPEMVKAAHILKIYSGDTIQFVLQRSPIIDAHIYAQYFSPSVPIHIAQGSIYDTLSICDIALVCSGTATLETAIMNIPMIIVYKASDLSWFLFRRLVHIEHIGLCNVIAGKQIVPECLQKEACGDFLAQKISWLFSHPQELTMMQQQLKEVTKSLGPSGAAGRIAEYIVQKL